MKKTIIPCNTAIAKSGECRVTLGEVTRIMTKAEEEEIASKKLSKHKRK